jgi:AcrR family transcriptional regulator
VKTPEYEGMPESKRLSLRERNQQRIMQSIIDAAKSLFRSDGYEQTTMDAIAERAEVSRATLFNYFSSKSALLLPFAYELYKEKVQPEVLAYLDTSPSTLATLRVLFLGIHRHVLTLPDMEKALQEEFAQPKRTPKPQLHGMGLFEILMTILAYGQRREEVRADLPLESLARNVGVLYIALIHSTHIQPAESYLAEVELLLRFIGSALAA